jgi:hypothetical protein
MSIEFISDKVTWDRFIDRSPNSLLFHKWDFLKLVEKYTGYELFPYYIYRGEEPIAAIPIFYTIKKGLRFAYSPPQTTLSYIPYMGFAFSQAYVDLQQFERESYLAYMIQELEKALYHLSPNYISLAVEPGYVDARPYRMNGYEALLMYTYTIDLTRPLETIWKELDNSCRRKITAASKYKPSMEQSHDVTALFDAMRERLASNEKTFFKSQSPEYLKEIMAAFPDNIKMYSICMEGEVVGGCVNYEYRKRCTAWMGAPAADDRKDINEYMLWEIIKKSREEGFTVYENLGADEKRLNPFKSKFNPSLTPYYYMVKRDRLYRTASNTSEMLTRLFTGMHPGRMKASMLTVAPAAGGE